MFFGTRWLFAASIVPVFTATTCGSGSHWTNYFLGEWEDTDDGFEHFEMVEYPGWNGLIVQGSRDGVDFKATLWSAPLEDTYSLILEGDPEGFDPSYVCYHVPEAGGWESFSCDGSVSDTFIVIRE